MSVNIGRRIYYEKLTGEVILNTGDKSGVIVPLTIEQEIDSYKVLSERNEDTFDVIELEYGQYAQDFAECNGYRINPDTKEIEFSYPDPNELGSSEPVYRVPLSEEVDDLKKENSLLSSKVDALTSHNELIEGAIIDLTNMILG